MTFWFYFIIVNRKQIRTRLRLTTNLNLAVISSLLMKKITFYIFNKQPGKISLPIWERVLIRLMLKLASVSRRVCFARFWMVGFACFSQADVNLRVDSALKTVTRLLQNATSFVMEFDQNKQELLARAWAVYHRYQNIAGQGMRSGFRKNPSLKFEHAWFLLDEFVIRKVRVWVGLQGVFRERPNSGKAIWVVFTRVRSKHNFWQQT